MVGSSGRRSSVIKNEDESADDVTRGLTPDESLSEEIHKVEEKQGKLVGAVTNRLSIFEQ